MEGSDVLLVGRAGVETNVLYNALAARFRVEVILENPPSMLKLLRWRIRNVGLLRAAGQLMFQLLVMIHVRTASWKRQRMILAEAGLITTPPPLGSIGHIPSVNAPQLSARIAEAPPRVVVINGTRIVTARALEAWKVPVLNMHAGITPRYRGVHGAYWALVQKDREHCGVTVHLVAPGVDTGGILHQATIEPVRKDSFATYPILQLAAGIPLLVQAVEEVMGNNAKPVDGTGPDRRWYHPTLWQYLWYLLTRGVR